ncbi:MAG: hypothetical protein V3V16_06745 [Melioribacteraceae bacterium]
MKNIGKNILAIIAGWLVGSVINLSLIKLGHLLLPIEGVDPNDMEALAAVMPTLEFKYFIFPFLAHAIGTLIGAIVAGLIAINHKMKFALGIGAIFLMGGILVSFMLPAPTWFVIVDLVLAYIPMAWIGGKLATRKSQS